jgi:hypothetical protein
VKLSESRISHLAHLILEAATQDDLARPRNTRIFLNEVKRVLTSGTGGRNDEIDAVVRRKIASLSRTVVPGSTEWDVLYRQYTEAERRRRG